MIIKKRSSKKIPAHYGMNDYYNYFCDKYLITNITKKQFNNIITEYNTYISNSLIDSLEIILPFKFGKLEILKQFREVYMNKDGKVINTTPVNWKETNHLWHNNEEAKLKKILIRYNNKHTGGYVFRVKYNKHNAIYKNKKLYLFKPVRNLSRNIAKRINDYSKDKYDTYIKK